MVALVGVTACNGNVDGPAAPGDPPPLTRCEDPMPTPPAEIVPISPTRQLRRVTLALAGRGPTDEEYDAILAAGDESAQRAAVLAVADRLLADPAFYDRILEFGHDWVPVQRLRVGMADESYWGSQATNIYPCDDGSAHPGAFYPTGESGGPSEALCDDPTPTVSIEPWWAPGTTVEVVAAIGSDVRSAGGRDCGQSEGGYYDRTLPDPGCSCGPNLVYCIPHSGFALHTDGDENLPLRQAWDEPARLLAHIAWHDRPLTDFVVGNYTVAPLMLRHLYVRMGRQNSEFAALDDDESWWRSTFDGAQDPHHAAPTDPLAWREIVIEKLDPFLMSLSGGVASADLGRTYHHDPRVTNEPIEGIAASGALTTLAVQSSFPRERVRAARLLETFACHQFTPPPPDSHLGNVDLDIALEGECQYCHRLMDPAAIHFKRWSFGLHYIQEISYIPGTSTWPYESERLDVQRWEQLYIPGTVLTPATEAELAINPDARLLDFLPPERELFGLHSDGTNGPLGFAKLLVESGRFDECAVRRIYERFVGRPLDPSREAGYIAALVQEFVDGDRRVRPFVRALVARPDFLHGAIRRTP
jgi:hypothetical protein